eukprot:COSAG06_NODE_6994_length_2683_cov_62.353702_2_plen_78_part_00
MLQPGNFRPDCGHKKAGPQGCAHCPPPARLNTSEPYQVSTTEQPGKTNELVHCHCDDYTKHPSIRALACQCQCNVMS